MSHYSQEEIEKLSNNPCVRIIKEDRLSLTYEFRVRLYEAWKKEGRSGILKLLKEADLGEKTYCGHFVGHLACNFARFGYPKNGEERVPVRNGGGKENEDILLKTGKFVKSRNGISFAKEFAEELKAGYPEQTIAEGIRKAGIDPNLVGYYRMYSLERRFLSGNEDSSSQQGNERSRYPEEEMARIRLHPYVSRVTPGQLSFYENLYADAQVLAEANVNMDGILEVFEIPETWVKGARKISLYYHFRKGQSGRKSIDRFVPEQLNGDAAEQFLRIEYKRMKKLEAVVVGRLESVKQQMPDLTPAQKMMLCDWVKNVPKEEKGLFSTRGYLKMLGISKSFYYKLVNDDTYRNAYEARLKKEEEDRETVRRVVEYGGFPKGKRQVYMQMPLLENKRMGLNKITRLMREMDLLCPVRKANHSRRAARLHLTTHVKPNLLKRRFRLERPGKIFLTDVTYMKYSKGKKLAYGSALIDSVTGFIHSFDISEFNNLDLALATLRSLPDAADAYEELKPLLHSDQGVLYLSDEFQELVRELGFEQSMSKRGNCWDNAPVESMFGHFKDECLYQDVETLEELRSKVGEFRVYYNTIRGRWNQKKMTPEQFERYLTELPEEEFQKWLEEEEARYEKMRETAKQKAIERNKTLGV